MLNQEESNVAAEMVRKFHEDCQRRRALEEAKNKDREVRKTKDPEYTKKE